MPEGIVLARYTADGTMIEGTETEPTGKRTAGKEYFSITIAKEKKDSKKNLEQKAYIQEIEKDIRNFEKMGLRPIISRNSINSMTNRGNGVKGAYSTSPNRQFDYDHKSDRAMYLDKAFVERRLEVLRTSYEAYKELAAVYAGPAVIEVFGEKLFSPKVKKESPGRCTGTFLFMQGYGRKL